MRALQHLGALLDHRVHHAAIGDDAVDRGTVLGDDQGAHPLVAHQAHGLARRPSPAEIVRTARPLAARIDSMFMSLLPLRRRRDVVVELVGDAGRLAAAPGRRRARHAAAPLRRPARTLVVAEVAAAIVAAATALAAAAEQGQLAPEAREHDLGGIALLAALVGPFAGLQLALDIDRAALAQVALGDVGQILVEDHHAVPLGALAVLARLAVAPALRGGDPQVDDLLIVLRVPHLGIAPEIAHQDHLVDAAGHDARSNPRCGPVMIKPEFAPQGNARGGPNARLRERSGVVSRQISALDLVQPHRPTGFRRAQCGQREAQHVQALRPGQHRRASVA